jgi:hypothetical protein
MSHQTFSTDIATMGDNHKPCTPPILRKELRLS